MKELLLLMDIEEPSSDLKWINMLDEFLDMEKHDIVEVNSLHRSLLSKIRWMGTDNTHRVHTYCDKLIDSLFSLDKVVFSQNGSIAATKDWSEATSWSEATWDWSEAKGNWTLPPFLGIPRIREYKRGRILKWLDDVRACQEVEEVGVIEVVDNEESEGATVVGAGDGWDDSDMATPRSYESSHEV